MYKIVRTDKAEDQLRDIIFYIADDSGSIDTALKYLDKIEEAINRLKKFPNSGSIPRYYKVIKKMYNKQVLSKSTWECDFMYCPYCNK